tara:strand:+ start:8337 stop:8852 length:516 start_codon:yes stop_codon:yes gene_type:complete
MAKKQTVQIGNETVKLTDRELLFANHYIISNNATDAALKAGYSEKCAGQQGFENLKKPEILRYIHFKTKPIMDQLGINQERVLRELAAIAFSDFKEVFNDDWTLKPLKEMDPNTTPAIKSLEKTERGVKVHLHDKLSALNRLWEIVKPNQVTNDTDENEYLNSLDKLYLRN